MKKKIHHFLNESPWGSALLTVLILFSILIFALETEYQNSHRLTLITFCIAIIFGVEYVLRIWSADYSKPNSLKAKREYIFSFGGIVDLLAFLPALLMPGANGSVILRLLRILRLVQLMKIKPLTAGIKRTGAALYETRTELAVSISISIALIFVGAVAMYLIEGDIQPDAFGSVPRALWWSMATMTTVGYGDVYPVTAAGKVTASLMAIVGIGAVALPAGILAAAFASKD